MRDLCKLDAAVRYLWSRVIIEGIKVFNRAHAVCASLTSFKIDLPAAPLAWSVCESGKASDARRSIWTLRLQNESLAAVSERRTDSVLVQQRRATIKEAAATSLILQSASSVMVCLFNGVAWAVWLFYQQIKWGGVVCLCMSVWTLSPLDGPPSNTGLRPFFTRPGHCFFCVCCQFVLSCCLHYKRA